MLLTMKSQCLDTRRPQLQGDTATGLVVVVAVATVSGVSLSFGVLVAHHQIQGHSRVESYAML